MYFPDYPDYQLENFNCNGNEIEMEDCIQGEWKTGTGICDVKTNAYAAVCCSNSSDFGGNLHRNNFQFVRKKLHLLHSDITPECTRVSIQSGILPPFLST